MVCVDCCFLQSRSSCSTQQLTYVQSCGSVYTLACSVFDALNALCDKPPPSQTQRKATFVRVWILNPVLIGLGGALAINTQHSLDSSLPVHKTERERVWAPLVRSSTLLGFCWVPIYSNICARLWQGGSKKGEIAPLAPVDLVVLSCLLLVLAELLLDDSDALELMAGLAREWSGLTNCLSFCLRAPSYARAVV
jgi:hypothetical protein